MPGKASDPFTSGPMHNLQYVPLHLVTTRISPAFCLHWELSPRLPALLPPSGGARSSPSFIAVEDVSRLGERVWGKKSAFPGKVSQGLAQQINPWALLVFHPPFLSCFFSQQASPQTSPDAAYSWYFYRQGAIFIFDAFSSSMPPQTKIYYHRGPLWINDPLTALFTRGWGGSRSLRVWQWGRLELLSS